MFSKHSKNSNPIILRMQCYKSQAAKWKGNISSRNVSLFPNLWSFLFPYLRFIYLKARETEREEDRERKILPTAVPIPK